MYNYSNMAIETKNLKNIYRNIYIFVICLTMVTDSIRIKRNNFNYFLVKMLFTRARQTKDHIKYHPLKSTKIKKYTALTLYSVFTIKLKTNDIHNE